MPGHFRKLTRTCWVHQSEIYATNSGILVDGGSAYLIDPGITSGELAEIAAFVATRGAGVRGIILTHAHWDHLLGAAHFPAAEVIAQQRYSSVVAAHGKDLQRQVCSWARAGGEEGYEAFAAPRPTMLFDSRLTIRSRTSEWYLLAAPGHAPDHCVIYEPGTRLLWAGDMLSDLEIPMVMETFTAYLGTLAELSALDVRVLVPGHGTPTCDRGEIRARFAQDQAYLRALWACVDATVAQGATLQETLTVCRSVPFAQPDSYPCAHQWNIEQAYLEAGGRAAGRIGWVKDWAAMGSKC